MPTAMGAVKRQLQEAVEAVTTHLGHDEKISSLVMNLAIYNPDVFFQVYSDLIPEHLWELFQS